MNEILDSKIFDLITITITLTSAYVMIKYQLGTAVEKIAKNIVDIKHNRAMIEKNKEEIQRTRELDLAKIDQRFDVMDKRIYEVRDELVQTIHRMDNKITEIHTILTQK